MATREVDVTGHAKADPQRLWQVVSNFCGAWHPLIAEIRAERDRRGALIRAFRAHGEETLYREQLTYLSDSDFTLRYTHLEGIAGVERYDGEIRLEADPDGGSIIHWHASLSAPEGRAEAIAEGTRAIFEMGVKALADMMITPPARRIPFRDPGVMIRTWKLDGAPILALDVSAEKPGPLLLFLHGIGGARGNWQAQLQAMAPYCSTAALDLRGYGESSLGANQTTIEDYCADILRVAEALHAEKLILCGLSYGSWIATSFAMRHPDRLAGLVLSGGCTGMSEAGVEERTAFREARQVPLDQGKTPADFAPAVVNVLAGPDADTAVRETLFQSMAAIPAATYRDALHCFTNPPERFDFSRLTMPVLMMTGEFDRLASPAEIRGVARRIATLAPQASVRFEVIDRAGHVCNIENPDAYNRILGDFVADLTG